MLAMQHIHVGKNHGLLAARVRFSLARTVPELVRKYSRIPNHTCAHCVEKSQCAQCCHNVAECKCKRCIEKNVHVLILFVNE